MPPASQAHYEMDSVGAASLSHKAWHNLLGQQIGLFWLMNLEVEVQDWAASLVWVSLKGSTM